MALRCRGRDWDAHPGEAAVYPGRQDHVGWRRQAPGATEVAVSNYCHPVIPATPTAALRVGVRSPVQVGTPRPTRDDQAGLPLPFGNRPTLLCLAEPTLLPLPSAARHHSPRTPDLRPVPAAEELYVAFLSPQLVLRELGDQPPPLGVGSLLFLLKVDRMGGACLRSAPRQPLAESSGPEVPELYLLGVPEAAILKRTASSWGLGRMPPSTPH